jgi:CHAT domain-containing protein
VYNDEDSTRMARLVVLSALGFSLAIADPWGSAASREFADRAIAKRVHGDYAGALAIYQNGYDHAVRTANPKAQIKFLNSIGGCHYLLYHFQPALRTWTEARRLAEQHPSEIEEHGAVLFNIAALYLGSANVSAAAEAANEGVALLRSFPGKTYYRSRLNLIRAVIAARGEHWDAASRFYRNSIEAADDSGDDRALGLAYNHFAQSMLAKGDLRTAEQMFLAAHSIRRVTKDPDLIYTYIGLGELELARGDARLASNLVNAAEQMAGRDQRPIPRELTFGLRARIFSSQAMWQQAHEAFVKAFASIRSSRSDLLPADYFRVNSEASLGKLYEDALRNAADWKRYGNPPATLASEVWLLTEEWKASAASYSPQERDQLHARLGASYWEMLAELRQLERKSFAPSRLEKSQAERLDLLRLRLAEMESGTGLHPFFTHFYNIFSENFPTVKRLSLFQRGLGNDSALIRFHVGPRVVLRWTLTKAGLAWKELACGQDRLKQLVRQFTSAIQADSQQQRLSSGTELSALLFQDLAADVVQSEHWLLALDGPLLELPASALSTGPIIAGRPRYLIEDHSLVDVLGAQVLLPAFGDAPLDRRGALKGAFVGIGDAVYNTADPRWGKQPASEPGRFVAESQATSAVPLQLPRLVSSRQELETSAEAWGGPRRLLLGKNANRREAVDSIEAGAEIVHFAAHFLQKDGSPDRAMLLLSLDAHGQPDFFSPFDTVHVKVPGSLVVLSGCHSGAGTVYPGAGLIGLTRSWLTAGASGVLASLWPTPDDTGAIFQVFYHKLQSGISSGNGDGYLGQATTRPRGGPLRKAADALRHAQLEMLRTHSWRASPKYWGTYQLVGRTI